MNSSNNSLQRLKGYCEREQFKGWDPFDALNSRFFLIPALKKNRLFRLFWIQLFKRSPVNLRPFFGVPKSYNPKGLGLFIGSYLNLYKATGEEACLRQARLLSELLLKLRSPGYSNTCWGYNFDWQSRAFYLPKFTPNVIVSTFAGQAFLDLYELTRESRCLEIARSAGIFIVKDLHRAYKADGTFCFSYSPLDHSRIFNASLLASRYLARLSAFDISVSSREDIRSSIEFCLEHQRPDGSWGYGLAYNQHWVDSFHTGYNLEALYDYQRYTGDSRYQGCFEKGKSYYLDKFFTDKGIPKFYPDRLYPIDVHSAAELIVFLCRTDIGGEHQGLLHKVMDWTLRHMQDKKGYFHYQVNKYHHTTIPYIRWACAWMMYALSLYLYKTAVSSKL